MAKNNNIFIENGVKMVMFEGEKMPVVSVCVATTKKICEYLNATYTDGANDNGVDAIGADGTRYQIKVLYSNDSSTSYTTDIDVRTGYGKTGKARAMLIKSIIDYAKKFDVLVFYKGFNRGDVFNPDKLVIIEGYANIVRWLLGHTHASYMRYAEEIANGRMKSGRCQAQIRANEREELLKLVRGYKKYSWIFA